MVLGSPSPRAEPVEQARGVEPPRAANLGGWYALRNRQTSHRCWSELQQRGSLINREKHTVAPQAQPDTNGGVAGRFVTSGGAGLVLQGLSGNSGRQVFFVDANGNGFFAGNLSKASGSFKIDHPLDPANKYLSHSFVESPDMMDVYNGVVVLDAQGSAWVELPEYFQALNRDFRYQLTPLGAPGPNLYIAEEVTGNRFKISGGKPSGKVSWQVTGIRQDAYANAHRIAVEEAKPAEVRGQYLHPELFGAPKERAIAAAHRQHVQPVLAATTAAIP